MVVGQHLRISLRLVVFLFVTAELLTVSAESKAAFPSNRKIAKQLRNSIGDILSIGAAKGKDAVANLASRAIDSDSVAAVNTVRGILGSVHDHGVVNVFRQYSKSDVLLSILALHRLQECELWGKKEVVRRDVSAVDAELVSDLSHYSRYASAAYGWMMNFALGIGFHFGDMNIVTRKTGLHRSDILDHMRESKSHRPAYFIARDVKKNSIVVCIRGTWSPHDVLTDLCCSSDDLHLPSEYTYSSSGWSPCKKVRAHLGMISAAEALRQDIEEKVRVALKEHPGYKLVIVGHSMGGGIGSLLGTRWRTVFPGLQVYAFGPPCVSTLQSSLTENSQITSVVSEGDPFRALSLGHVADISSAIAMLCEDPLLRHSILLRTNGDIHAMSKEDAHWSQKTLNKIRASLQNEKLFPPGRLILLRQHISSHNQKKYSLETVSADSFSELRISNKMFDLTKHVPSQYEFALKEIEKSLVI